MPIVVGISLRVAGKIYSFAPGEESYYLGERVLVETARGVELGTVRLPPYEISEEQVVQPLKRVLRRATSDDLQTDAANREREVFALDACKQHIERLNLPMRLIDAQYTFDGSHVLINFQAENRVDFRELVRDLARELHTRIELRQVGVRDEAKLLDGYGMCGRRLCCSAFLTNFTPVAINMAKAQGLALNPQKISGTCGRLMCCLAFEYEHYSELRVGMPKVNAHIDTPRGAGKVTKVNALGRQVEVTFPDDDTPVWFTIDELHPDAAAVPPCAAAGCGGCNNHGPHDAFSPSPREEQQTPVAIIAPSGDARDDANTQPRSRNRRRRGKNRPGQDDMQTGAPVNPASTANNSGNVTEFNRPPQRQRPPKPAHHDGAPSNTTPPVDGAPVNPAKPNSFPSGRYRPRRRR